MKQQQLIICMKGLKDYNFKDSSYHENMLNQLSKELPAEYNIELKAVFKSELREFLTLTQEQKKQKIKSLETGMEQAKKEEEERKKEEKLAEEERKKEEKLAEEKTKKKEEREYNIQNVVKALNAMLAGFIANLKHVTVEEEKEKCKDIYKTQTLKQLTDLLNINNLTDPSDRVEVIAKLEPSLKEMLE